MKKKKTKVQLKLNNIKKTTKKAATIEIVLKHAHKNKRNIFVTWMI